MQTMIIIGESDRRAELKQILRGQRGIELIGEISDSAALRHVPELEPDIVVVDCAAPSINTIQAIQRISNLPHTPRIVALAATHTPAERAFLLDLGAAYARLETPATVCEALGIQPIPAPVTPPRWNWRRTLGMQPS